MVWGCRPKGRHPIYRSWQYDSALRSIIRLTESAGKIRVRTEPKESTAYDRNSVYH